MESSIELKKRQKILVSYRVIFKNFFLSRFSLGLGPLLAVIHRGGSVLPEAVQKGGREVREESEGRARGSQVGDLPTLSLCYHYVRFLV